MKKKVIICSIISIMAMAGSANAEDIKLNGFYAGTGLSNIKLSGVANQTVVPGQKLISQDYSSKNVPELHIGYEFAPNIGIEYRRYLKKWKGKETKIIGQANIYGNVDLKNMQSFLLKAGEDYGKVNFKVIGGYTTAKINSSYLNQAIVAGSFPDQTTVDGFNLHGFTYGASVGYKFTKNVSVNAEYLHLFKSQGITARSIGTNIEYRF